MIALKDYQRRVLGSLRDFLNYVSRGVPLNQAFHDVQLANNRPPAPYLPVVAAGLRPEMPYVCLRVPTGGGKTMLASHAVGLAKHELLRAERAVALWLVPSNTILDQTVDALRDPRHHYRRALEISCAGPVEVVPIEDALSLPRAAGVTRIGRRTSLRLSGRFTARNSRHTCSLHSLGNTT